MNAALRDFFDEHLEAVLAELPAQVTRLLDEVPMIVEDYPSPQIPFARWHHRAAICAASTPASP